MDEYSAKIPLQSSSLFLYPTNKTKIEKLVQKLANKESTGYDGISNTLLKEVVESIIYPLVNIFNKSLSCGVFPDRMKYSDITLLYKSKCKHDKNNYRLISLLLTFSKILEKVMYKRSYQFLENTNQLYVKQYGFRSRHSCEHAVSELLSEILKGHECKKKTLAIFIDLSKAFDTLLHSILFK